MIKSIATLSVGVVLSIVAVAVSSHPSTAASGKGSGTSYEVKDTDDYTGILADLPTYTDYAFQSLSGTSDTSGSQNATLAASATGSTTSATSKIRPVTVHNTVQTYEGGSSSESNSSLNVACSRQSGTVTSADIWSYYTEDGVYYDLTYSVIEDTYSKYYKYETRDGSTAISTLAKTKKTLLFSKEDYSKTEFQVELYIGSDAAYIRFDDYDVEERNENYVDEDYKDKLYYLFGVTEADLETETEKITSEKLADAFTEAVRENSGKWINLTAGIKELGSKTFDITSLTASSITDEVVKYYCIKSCVDMAQTAISMGDSYEGYAATYATYFTKDGLKNFNQKGDTYYMNAPAIATVLKSKGMDIDDETLAKLDKEDCSYISSYLSLDLSDETAPTVTQFMRYSNGSSHSDDSISYSGSETYIEYEKLAISNIDNTKVPTVPDTEETICDVLSEATKKAFDEED